MIRFLWHVYLKVLRATWSVFGWSRIFLRTLYVMPLRVVAMHGLLFLDHLFFPGFRATPLPAPLFLFGHPRSATTFLHRLLTSTGQWGAFRYWHLLMPSLTGRVLMAPWVRWLVRRGRDVFYPKEVGHELRLESVEEDELLFLHVLNSQFMAVTTAWGLGDDDFEEMVFWDSQPEAVRRKTMGFYRECLRRQLYFTRAPRLACNANYSAMRLRSIFQVFPQAKVIYLVRSPLETIPSHLTLHRNMFHHAFGPHRVPEDRLRRYALRRYRANVAYYRYVEDLFAQGILHSGNCLVIPYEELRDHLEEVGERIARFTDCPFDPALRRAFREAAQAQSGYRRPHHNAPLESFGLRAEDIVRDLGFVLEKYGWGPTQGGKNGR
ncbi:sulfotransferase [Desulfosoma sp.]